MSWSKNLGDWFDERTGYRALVKHSLEEPVPGGARWAYIFGSVLVGCIALQAITGWTLMAYYAPSATTAWASVEHITYGVSGGWLVRGMHHFGAQAMVVVLALHLAASRGVRRLQVAARGQLVVGARADGHHPRLLAHRLPSPLGPKGLLGHPRRHQHRGHHPGRRQSDAEAGARRRRVRQPHVDPLLHAPRGHLAGAHRGAAPRPPRALPQARRDPSGQGRSQKVDPFFPNQLALDVGGVLLLLIAVGYLPCASTAPLSMPRPIRPATIPLAPSGISCRSSSCSSISRARSRWSARILVPGLAGGYLALLPLWTNRPPARSGPACVTWSRSGSWGSGFSGSRSSRCAPTHMTNRSKKRGPWPACEPRQPSRSPARGSPEGPLTMMRRDPETRGAALFGEILRELPPSRRFGPGRRQGDRPRSHGVGFGRVGHVDARRTGRAPSLRPEHLQGRDGLGRQTARTTRRHRRPSSRWRNPTASSSRSFWPTKRPK